MTEQINDINFETMPFLSDDDIEMEVPKRKPIGWNYQNAINPPKDDSVSPSKHDEQLNGEPHNINPSKATFQRNPSSDDVEVLEVKNISPPTVKRLNLQPTTRQEMKQILRHVTQTSIPKFFSHTSQPNKHSQTPSTSMKPGVAYPPSHRKSKLKRELNVSPAGNARIGNKNKSILKIPPKRPMKPDGSNGYDIDLTEPTIPTKNDQIRDEDVEEIDVRKNNRDKYVTFAKENRVKQYHERNIIKQMERKQSINENDIIELDEEKPVKANNTGREINCTIEEEEIIEVSEKIIANHVEKETIEEIIELEGGKSAIKVNKEIKPINKKGVTKLKRKESKNTEKENKKFGNINESHSNEKLAIPSTSKGIKIEKMNKVEKKTKDEEKEKNKKEIKKDEKEKVITSEYSQSVLKNFIQKWKDLHPFSKDDEKIAEKIWRNYFACHTSFTHSRKFVDDLQKATENLNKTETVFLNISKLIEYLKRYKETQYVEKKKLLEVSDDEGSDSGTLSKEEAKRKRKMAKIENKMMILTKKINKYETADVDLDDEVNSSYLILERLKLKFVKLDEFYCKLANCSTFTGRPTEKKFKYQGSRYPEINKRITAWVNKNRCFPEYMDVLDLVKAVTKRNELPLRPETIRVQAQEIFREVGQILQERRIADDLFSICAYASINEDQEESLMLNPADTDHDLRQKLKVNEESAKQKFDEVFQHYVDKEAELKDTKDKLFKEAKNEKRAREDSAQGNPEEKRQKKQDEDETSDEDKEEGDEDKEASDEKDASDEEKDASDEEKDVSDDEKDASDYENDEDKDESDKESVTNKSDSEESEEKPVKRLKMETEKDYDIDEFSEGDEKGDREDEAVIESVESPQENTEDGRGTTSSDIVEGGGNEDDKDKKSEEKGKVKTSPKVTPSKTESVARTGAQNRREFDDDIEEIVTTSSKPSDEAGRGDDVPEEEIIEEEYFTEEDVDLAPSPPISFVGDSDDFGNNVDLSNTPEVTCFKSKTDFQMSPRKRKLEPVSPSNTKFETQISPDSRKSEQVTTTGKNIETQISPDCKKYNQISPSKKMEPQISPSTTKFDQKISPTYKKLESQISSGNRESGPRVSSGTRERDLNISPGTKKFEPRISPGNKLESKIAHSIHELEPMILPSSRNFGTESLPSNERIAPPKRVRYKISPHGGLHSNRNLPQNRKEVPEIASWKRRLDPPSALSRRAEEVRLVEPKIPTVSEQEFLDDQWPQPFEAFTTPVDDDILPSNAVRGGRFPDNLGAHPPPKRLRRIYGIESLVPDHRRQNLICLDPEVVEID